MLKYFIGILLLSSTLQGVEFSQLSKTVVAIQAERPPLPHDLKIKLLKGRAENEEVLLLLHGMGSDNRIADVLQTYEEIPDHLISFNFPDAGINIAKYEARRTSFGTIYEVLPVLYLLKKLVVDGGIKEINIYGFSAGGGALVNSISVLNTENYDAELRTLGITQKEKRAILAALQKGTILLDVSLKSMKEIIDFRGKDKSLEIVANRYQLNHFEPIESLKYWNGLSLRVLVYFETPDEALSNRDDALFIDRLRAFNKGGTVQAFSGNNGGHATYHKALWKAYLAEKSLKP